jgi:hypothetical protein
MLDYKLEISGIDEVSGHVIVKVPSMKERLKLLKDAGVNDKNSELGMDLVIQMMDRVSEFVKSAEIKVGDQKFSDLEAIGHYAFAMEIFQQVSAVIMNGIPLGKPLTSQ